MARNAAAAVARQVIKMRKVASSSASGYACRFGTRLLSFNFNTTELPLSKMFHFSNLQHQHQHRFVSSSHYTPTDPSGITVIQSVEQFTTAFENVKDGSLPAVFYFTALWCAPCKYMTPVIEEMAIEHPHVAFYKIDIDQEGIGDQLSELKITAVPTFHFFKNGKFMEEIVGADRKRLKAAVKKHYIDQTAIDQTAKSE